jgi:dinuclear metal center YbgI/SA1388 family protein
MKPPVQLRDISGYLDALLRISEIPDDPAAVNGLQVENGGAVYRIMAAVDASLATIDLASRERGTLLLVHHGLLWDGNVPITGRRHRRIRRLFEGDTALYSAHIPLDVHPELGNNVALAGLLQVPVEGWFGNYRGIQLGVYGTINANRDGIVSRLDGLLGSKARVIPGGPEQVSRIGIVTGAGGRMVHEAIAAGCDAFITGEGAHHTFFDATEGGINLIYAGHYATEKLGVQRLAERLSDYFDIPWSFHEDDTGL